MTVPDVRQECAVWLACAFGGARLQRGPVARRRRRMGRCRCWLWWSRRCRAQEDGVDTFLAGVAVGPFVRRALLPSGIELLARGALHPDGFAIDTLDVVAAARGVAEKVARAVVPAVANAGVWFWGVRVVVDTFLAGVAVGSFGAHTLLPSGVELQTREARHSHSVTIVTRVVEAAALGVAEKRARGLVTAVANTGVLFSRVVDRVFAIRAGVALGLFGIQALLEPGRVLQTRGAGHSDGGAIGTLVVVAAARGVGPKRACGSPAAVGNAGGWFWGGGNHRRV